MNDRHIATVLALHFDPDQGSPYWLQRQQQLGFDVRREIRGHADFHRLGPMDVSALRTRPLTDFIPRALHRHLATMLLSETGGTTGDPCRRVFSPREFDSAFIAPWLKAVAEHGFPRQGCWLFVGPGGPHIIDRSARFIDNGRIVTSAGISAGIDTSLHVVGQLFGTEMADKTASYMEYRRS